jgi:hypothetical protein
MVDSVLLGPLLRNKIDTIGKVLSVLIAVAEMLDGRRD